MKKIYCLLILTACIIYSSCREEYKEELYRHYISFKAPLNYWGVTRINVRYKREGKVTYELPLIVSGSTANNKNIEVHVGIDSDTLRVLNYEQFQDRKDLHYREMDASFFSFPETVPIPSGENSSVMPIDFSLESIDLSDKWILPLTILDHASYNYVAHPRKHYRKALLYVEPFNDYSGIYSGTGLKIYFKGYENEAAIVRSEIPSYVADENSIFFYAGTVDENNIERKKYKIYANFDKTGNIVTLSADNPEIDFRVNKTPTYKIQETMDEVRPYLLHRYITINNIDYQYSDYTTVPGTAISYTVKGSLMMERKINTQIPDEDQAIEW